jgi:hypothetical protein
MMRRGFIASLAVALAGWLAPSVAQASAATVLYNDTAFEVANTLADPDDLWVGADDLERINGFVLKSHQLCLDALCVPAAPNSDVRIQRSGKTWISVTELARQLRQAVAFDGDRSVWSLGEIPSMRATFFDKAVAPDFTLLNRQGQPVSLKDFRGKKVLIVTWASW